MSRASSDNGPSHQSSTIDRTHHETVYRRYNNHGYHASEGGIINVNHYHADSQGTMLLSWFITIGFENPSEELDCSPSTALHSAEHFDRFNGSLNHIHGRVLKQPKRRLTNSKSLDPSQCEWIHYSLLVTTLMGSSQRTGRGLGTL